MSWRLTLLVRDPYTASLAGWGDCRLVRPGPGCTEPAGKGWGRYKNGLGPETRVPGGWVLSTLRRGGADSMETRWIRPSHRCRCRVVDPACMDECRTRDWRWGMWSAARVGVECQEHEWTGEMVGNLARGAKLGHPKFRSVPPDYWDFAACSARPPPHQMPHQTPHQPQIPRSPVPQIPSFGLGSASLIGI